ncbi:MAG TPA: hypothetical protein PLV92_09505, partial [Pirellulaceae bacterium]|nr:hypothetical protein [Pirellulaceae bacterium]
MEKRLFLFFVLSALILGGQFFINAKFGPKRPPKKDNAAEVAGKDAEKDGDQDGGKSGDDAGKTDKDSDAKPGTEKSGDKPSDKPTEKPGEKGAENDPSGKSADGKDATNEKEPPKPAVPPQWVTLGSLDPASGYRMLVTLNNRGAAVERIELSSPRYYDLETPQGYLGHLALTPDPDGKGSRVHAVGPGTPAALATADDGKSPAGIKVGDLILEINGEETP